MENETQIENQGKTVAIVSFLSTIGWLIAYFGMYPKAKTSLASYHLRQTLLFYIVSIVVEIIAVIVAIIVAIITRSAIVDYVFDVVVYLVLVILWIIGFIAAVQGQEKPMPLIGKKAQKMFPKI